MHTLTRFAPVFALLASTALVACDKGEDNKNLVGTTGESESESESESEDGGSTAGESGSETGVTETGDETGAAEVVCDAEHFQAGRPCSGGTQFCSMDYEDFTSYAEIRPHAENYVSSTFDAETRSSTGSSISWM